jgi:predicted acyltransferase
MVLVDGLDGYLAGSTQRLAAVGQTRAKAASRALGIIVVIFAFGLGGAELFPENEFHWLARESSRFGMQDAS